MSLVSCDNDPAAWADIRLPTFVKQTSTTILLPSQTIPIRKDKSYRKYDRNKHRLMLPISPAIDQQHNKITKEKLCLLFQIELLTVKRLTLNLY